MVDAPRVVQLSRLCLCFAFGVTVFFASMIFVATFTILGGSDLYGADAALAVGLAMIGAGLLLNYRRRAAATLMGLAGALAAPASVAVIASFGEQPDAVWIAVAILGVNAVLLAGLLTRLESRIFFAKP
jgi:hypothetical protein